MTHTRCIVSVLLLVTLTGAMDSSIVGGRVAEPHSRPYMASLQYDGHHSCGGILIQDDYVLTAAHCKDCFGVMTVVLGAHYIDKEEKSQQRINVTKYRPHPKYSGFHYDIMLLKLERKAKVNKYVKPTGLPEKDDKFPANVDCEVAGWGFTKPKGHASNVLREATEKIQFDVECSHTWKTNYTSQYMICTKFQKAKGGTCQGDSGGPLICNSELHGVTAYSAKDECDNPKFPHVFTKVPFFVPWIKKVMKE